MEVKVLSHTINPELTCAVAMRSTRTKEPAHKLLKENWKVRCTDAMNLYDRRRINKLDTKPHIKYHGCKYVNGNKCSRYNLCAERLLKRAKEMKHWGVLEHATFTVSVSGVSRSLTHQLVRHRIASYLQQSLRAVKPDEMIIPDSIEKLKQTDRMLYIQATGVASDMFSLYNSFIKLGIPKEDARFFLPIGTSTNIVITMNARSWLHFFKLRLDKHAQWEIREMAKLILIELKEIAPLIFEGAGELEV